MLTPNFYLPLKILLAVDGSPHAAAALSLVTHITWPAHTKIHVQAIVPESLPQMDAVTETRSQADETREIQRWRDWATAKILTGDVAEQLQAHHLTVETDICQGEPAQVILQQAVELKIDLLVAGAKGLAALDEARLGSTASKLALNAPNSVLLARPSTHIHPLNTILAIDSSSVAWQALGFLCGLSLPDWARVTLVSVVEEGGGRSRAGRPPVIPAPPNRYTTKALACLHDCGAQAQFILRYGYPADEILAIAQERAADLIVIGARRPAPGKPVCLDEVARQVTSQASCSVLVVR
ncbi:MAG: universal stress protein [Anaerolineae bacterium]|nr:universal stress protein [Anaerolineae bacterium]